MKKLIIREDRPDSDAKAREERNNAAGDGDEWERPTFPLLVLKWAQEMRIFTIPFMPEIPWTQRPEGLSLRRN